MRTRACIASLGALIALGGGACAGRQAARQPARTGAAEARTPAPPVAAEGPDGGEAAHVVAEAPRPAAPARAGACETFAAAGERSLSAAGDLARASSRDVMAPAAQLLSDLADALAAVPVPGGSGQGKALRELRFQAERLRRANRLNFGLAGWIREGLQAALDGLEGVARGASDGHAPWIAAARAAIAAIDEDGGLAFQRAPVQDAARATADAFVAVGRSLDGAGKDLVCSSLPGADPRAAN